MISRILNQIAAWVLFVLMLLTTADVVGRYLFNSPILGVFELTEFMLVCIVFFSLAMTQHRKGHIAVDILVDRFPKKTQNLIDIINHTISFLVLLLITWKSVERGFEIKAVNECSATLSIPVYPFVFMVALGSAAMCIELLRDLVAQVKGMVAP